MRATKAKVVATCYVFVSCNKVLTFDNQSSLFIHYVVQNWVRILILISLDYVLEGSRNLIRVIIEALTIGGVMPRD
jgi:hypothetical protein